MKVSKIKSKITYCKAKCPKIWIFIIQKWGIDGTDTDLPAIYVKNKNVMVMTQISYIIYITEK